MDKRYFIELTNQLYRTTLSIPKSEPLRKRTRDVADEVLVDLVVILEGDAKQRREAAFNVEKNIEVLDALFELIKKQKWVENSDLEDVREDYLTIKREVEEFNDMMRHREEKKEEYSAPEKEKEASATKERVLLKRELNERQEKILQLSREKKAIQVKDIQEVLPSATKRTLRRDLSDLVERGVLYREGSGNTTCYMPMSEEKLIGQG